MPFIKKYAGGIRARLTGLIRPLITGLLLFFVGLSGLSAQQGIMINTIVRPPYGTDLYNYANQTTVMITSSVTVEGYLEVHIRGDNGVDLRSGPDYTGPLVILSANEITQLNGIDLSGYFNPSNLISRGASMQRINDEGLPEGSYQVCFRMKGLDLGYVTAEEPSGCSNYFNIRYGQPPVLTNPRCGAVLDQPGIQSIAFSWTPATQAPVWTRYTLRIVELLDSTQNPGAAMLSATDPVFFETTVNGGFSFFYGPAQPLLEKGHIYAWQVIAEEEETNTKFANNGRSEVCWFKWDPSTLPLFSVNPQQEQVEVAEKPSMVTNVEPVPLSVVTGKLNYTFKGSNAVMSMSQQTVIQTGTGQAQGGTGQNQAGAGQSQAGSGQFQAGGNNQLQVQTGPGQFQAGGNNQLQAGGSAQIQAAGSGLLQVAMGDGLTYNTNSISTAGSRPLANVKVSLVLTYVLKGNVNNTEYNGAAIDMNDMREDNDFFAAYPDHEQILATTTTASDGSFSFQFMNTEQDLGLIDGNAYWTSGGGEFFDEVNGMLYKVIRLRVENKYFCSPDVNIKLEPWQALNLGTLVSYVKSYNLKVRTQWTPSTFYDVKGGQGKALDNVKTILLRKYQVPGIPSNEGGYATGSQFSIITYPKQLNTEYSQSDGTLLFTNLVQHDPDNTQDRYYVLCEPDENKGLYIFKEKERAYYPIHLKDKQQFPFNSQRWDNPDPNYPSTIYQAYGEDITWNSQLQVRTYEMTMELYPDKPRIAGKVEAMEVNAKPMSNITLMLLNTYKNSSNSNVLVRTAKTDANGYYAFDNLDLELGEFNLEGPTQVLGPDRSLFCTPPGFKWDVRNLGVLIWGQQEIQHFQMEPDGLLSGYVVDDKGNAVAADVQVDDLAFASTQIQLEYGSQGGQGGNVVIPGNSGGNVVIPANPGGNVVIPGNMIGNQGGNDSNAGNPGGNVVNAGNQVMNMTQAGNNMNVTQAGNNMNMSQTGNNMNMSQTGSAAVTQIQAPTGFKQVFSIQAPSGKGRTLTIIPKDPGYTTETYTVDVPKESNAEAADPMKPYVVYRMKKRVRFMVAEKPSTQFYNPDALKPVPYATVILKIPGGDITETTDARGNVVFEFENNATSFTFEIFPPENTDLENGTYTLNNVADSKTTVTYPPALLRKATRITGKVTLGNDQVALEHATVYIEKGNGERLEAKTDGQGNYTLTKVPLQPNFIRVWASKPNSVPNVTSQSKLIGLTNVNELNFVLQVDNEIAVQDIFGFEVDIKNKEKQDDDSYLISGALINLPGNDNFKLIESDLTIPFTGLKISKSGQFTQEGIPVGVPDVEDFETDVKDITLLLHDAFGAVQEDAGGGMLAVSSENGAGEIRGRTGILKSSFQYSDNYISFQENIPVYLTVQPGSQDMEITTLGTGDHPVKKFGVANASGNDIHFKFLAFDAVSEWNASWTGEGKIALATTLATNEIPGMVPSKLALDIGELVLKPTGIDPVTGTEPLGFGLEKWSFESAQWYLQQTKKGIYIPEGVIKTGLINVPVKNMLITPDNVEVGGFEMQNLTFSGVTPLHILTQNTSFGYNPSTGSDQKAHWELRIIGTQGAPGVSVAGLPGMKAGDELRFQSFSLLSNGEQQINMGNQQQELVFYDILKVKPLSFSGGDGYFEMSCNVDLNIPRIGAKSAVIRFSKPASQVFFEIYPFNVSFDGPGGVRFISGIAQGDQQLNNNGFAAIGTIKDKEGINLKGTLHRTNTAAWIEVDPLGQVMPLGGANTSLSDIEGRMEVQPGINDWSYFAFNGDLTGFRGMESNLRKHFVVHGSITADNESLGVKNIPTPFGGMAITYDIKNARMTGFLDIDAQMGAMRVKGAANMLVDATGWYFLMGGQLTTPGFGTMAAGMLIGDYPFTAPDVVQTVMQFAYDKNIPPSFMHGISGFFFTGRKDVPIINIPDFEINLGVLDARLGLSAGLDARLWMGFDDGGNEYGVGAMAFAHAWFSASSITCTKLSADARAELGAKGMYQTNTGIFSLSGCGSFTVSGSASQCFPTPCWDGICCEGCIGGGVSEGIRVDLLFDSTGKLNLDFGFGNCSGQSTLSGNW